MIRRALLAFTAASTLALSACGAEEASVVKKAFEQDIKSANVDVQLTFKAQGQSGGIALSGPFQSNGENKLPSLDWQMKLDGMLPQPIEGRLISTGDDAFVEYKGETYQVGKEQIKQLGALGAQGGGGEMSSADLGKMMGMMQDWFPESDATSDAELNGEKVTRITGKLDLSAALKDMKELAKQGGAGTQDLEQLGGREIAELDKAVSDPTFTLDVGPDDKLRRVAARMTINSDGEKGEMAFSITLKDVDKPVTIDAPESGKPIQELMQRLQQDFGGGGGSTVPAPEEITTS